MLREKLLTELQQHKKQDATLIPALSFLLTSHRSLQIRVQLCPILVLTGVSAGIEGNPASGIRFVPGNLIRFHGRIYSSKVIAKLQKMSVFSTG
jgi:hypothetical protein